MCAVNFQTQNIDGSCSCPSDRILVEVDETIYCKKCSTNCLTCSGTYDNCKSCKNPFILDDINNVCVCPEKTFLNINNQCIPCMHNCDKCTNSSIC